MHPSVLIVDDEPKIYHALRRALHREPYELVYAEDAEAALKQLEQHEIDVVISDENMPGMKGNELLARVRQDWPDVSRMMLTGHARIETVVSAVNRGEIFRFFLKPVNEAELVVSIREALRQRALRYEAARLLEKVRSHGSTSEQAAPVAGMKADENGVFSLDEKAASEDVDALLDEIRSELDKFEH